MSVSRLKVLSAVSLTALWLSAAPSALGSDQQKAEKRIHQISALALDGTARAIINQTMAEMVHAKRIELVRQRRAMNLNYGSLFIAHQLKAAGVQMLDIALQLEGGKNIVQIANERNADWKAIGNAAKKLNGKIEDNIYRYFQHPDADRQLAVVEKYDADSDIVRADLDVTQKEMAGARNLYVFWRNRAGAPNSGSLDSKTELTLGKSADIYKTAQRPHQ